MLERADIERLIPHKGSMCLLDRVLRWDEHRIEASSATHRDAKNPFEEHMIDMEKAADIFEDMIDTFWENPFAFSIFVNTRYRDDLVDIFAGRVYDKKNYTGIQAIHAFRKLLKRDRQYEPGTNFSMPYGSRYHAERAPLWNSALDSVETTERWMREQE